jgi:hypothetical protein
MRWVCALWSEVTDDVQTCEEHPFAVGFLLKKAKVSFLVPFFEYAPTRWPVVENNHVDAAFLELTGMVHHIGRLRSW